MLSVKIFICLSIGAHHDPSNYFNVKTFDNQVSNWESLAVVVASYTAVLILDPRSDCLIQISNYLNRFSGEQALAPLQSIQIISHDSAGSLLLGSSTVTNDNLKPYTSHVSTIGNALSEISTS